MDESSNTQNRRSRRAQLMMTGTLEWSGRSLPIKLRNLSSEGARVEGADLPIEGSALHFRKGDIAVDGRVIWVRGNQAGIQFVTLLDPAEVLNHVAAPRPRMTPDFRRPGLATRELTRTERKLAETWIQSASIPPHGD